MNQSADFTVFLLHDALHVEQNRMKTLSLC